MKSCIMIFFLITESNYKYISLHKYEVGKLEFMEATSISTLGKQILQIKKKVISPAIDGTFQSLPTRRGQVYLHAGDHGCKIEIHW